MKNNIYSNTVTGMICPQCEDEILSAMLHSRGIISVEASYRRSSVKISYDPDITGPEQIESLLENSGYPAGGNGRSGRISDLVSGALVLLLYFLIPRLTALARIPQLRQDSAFGMLFVIGLLTGVHCIGMCGGIMLTQHSPASYNTGRVLGYTLMGALFGQLGTAFHYDDTMKSMLLTLCGLLVVLIGLKQWGLPFLRMLPLEGKRPCQFRHGTPLLVGLATGLMPCGSLSAMWLYSASTGSALKGAEAMLAFSLGTLPFMLLFAYLGKLIPKKYNRYLLRAGTVLILALGLRLMANGLSLIP